MLKKRSLLLAMLAFMCGCTFSQDGVGIWWPVETPKEEYQDRRAQLIENAREAGKTDVNAEEVGILVTGSTGPYREFTEANIEEYYSEYIEEASKHRADDKPNYDLVRFRNTYSGWTTVSPIAIPTIGKIAVRALVPSDAANVYEFPDGVTSFLVGDTDDFVVAKMNSDGAFYIFRLLCPDNPDYGPCTRRFASGFFDQLTGQEVNPETGVPQANGNIIDTNNFEAIRKRKKARSTLE